MNDNPLQCITMSTRLKIPKELEPAVDKIARLIKKAGGKALIVGGAVRDMLLGKAAKDIDIEIFGVEADHLKEVLSQDFKLDLVGLSFGVIKLHHLDIDISLPRRESKHGLGHKGFEIMSDPFMTVEEAATRRDFTINAIYYDPLTQEIIDPYCGCSDLEKLTLRHVSPKFTEDPLRVLRGMQFIARFNLSPAQETIEICKTVEPEGLPPERLFAEWKKLLTKGIAISKGLKFLQATGWLQYYPELEALVGCEQDPKWHPEGDVWNHTLACLDAYSQNRTNDDNEELIVGLAVLCHDLGKPSTTKFENGHIRSRGHDEAGVEPTKKFLMRLTNEERILNEVPPLVACHMQPFALWSAHAGDAAVRRLSLKVKRLDRLVRVMRADDEGRPPFPPRAMNDEIKWLLETSERLQIAANAPRPILQGRDLISLGYKPSRQFGAILAKAFEAQLDGLFNTHEGAIDYFRKQLENTISTNGDQ